MSNASMAANRKAWKKYGQRLVLKKERAAVTLAAAFARVPSIRKSVSRRDGGMGGDVLVRGYTRSYPTKKG